MGVAGYSTKIFFLAGIVIVGVFGGWTVHRKILWVQALPGVVAMALVVMAGN
jgi:putative membrane protein